ncbi:class I SAM-dependent methyltransferase [Halosolutus halophilus]|uniref:class I SAM-dependent methyltransferase n=1 Tax=Halosolutus halophilus TaxID=1552990 RepID=UPI0022351B89|nr:class I SAM-dependent methyltransferase [Halosolutus halophilus]
MGFGAAHLTGELRDRSAPVVGLDVSRDMLTYARERAPDAGFVQADLGRPLPLDADRGVPAGEPGAARVRGNASERPPSPLRRIRVIVRSSGRTRSQSRRRESSAQPSMPPKESPLSTYRWAKK